MVAKWPQWEFTQRREFLRTDERCKVKRWTVKRWWKHSQESKTRGSENTTKKFQKETIKRIFDIHPVKHQSDSCTTGMDDNGDNGFHGIRTVERDRSYFLPVLDTVDFLNILCLASSCGSCEAPPVISALTVSQSYAKMLAYFTGMSAHMNTFMQCQFTRDFTLTSM